MEQDRLIRDEEEKPMPTEIICVVDRSGSMHTIVDDAIGGFNSFLHDQRQLEDEAYLTLYRFDDEVELVRECQPIKEFPNATMETFKPRGNTALWDAVGVALNDSVNRIKDSKVIVVIITDGHENASKHYNADGVKRMIEECRKMNWEFLFLGANIDAFAVGGDMGFAVNQTVQYAANSRGVETAYMNISDTVSMVRGSNVGSSNNQEGDH